jgi:hypothetical protein
VGHVRRTDCEQSQAFKSVDGKAEGTRRNPEPAQNQLSQRRSGAASLADYTRWLKKLNRQALSERSSESPSLLKLFL